MTRIKHQAGGLQLHPEDLDRLMAGVHYDPHAILAPTTTVSAP